MPEPTYPAVIDTLQRSAFNSTHELTAPVSRSWFRLHARRYWPADRPRHARVHALPAVLERRAVARARPRSHPTGGPPRAQLVLHRPALAHYVRHLRRERRAGQDRGTSAAPSERAVSLTRTLLLSPP